MTTLNTSAGRLQFMSYWDAINKAVFKPDGPTHARYGDARIAFESGMTIEDAAAWIASLYELEEQEYRASISA